MNILSNLVFFICELRLDLEGMGTKVISLSLKKIGWKILGSVTIKPGESSGESRSRDTKEGSLGNDISPAGLSLVNSVVKELVEEEILEVWFSAVSRGDILQEDGANDTTSTPHQGDGWLVELPLVFFGSLYIISGELEL
jgi:hypothetical protein